MPSVLKQLEGRGWDPNPVVVGLTFLAFACAVPLGAAATVIPNAATRATTACDPTQTRPFQPWGDRGLYVLAPGGALESETNTWRLRGGAKLARGNEPYHVHDASDNESLSLPSGSLAQTNKVCLELTSPIMRFFIINTGSSTSLLEIIVMFRAADGTLLESAPVATLSAGPSWQPTLPLSILANTAVPMGTKTVQFEFTPVGDGSGWRIDDLYVDPWVSRI
jgi:hypothetical protein